ncbi:MAG: PQQ-binding-like beta-propeller repeat protein [Gemmataceae bacterium]
MNSILPLILCTCLAQADAAEAAPSGDEQLLQAAGVPTTGPALLEFFQQRTLNDLARLKVGTFVDRLGHDDFLIREEAGKELLALGPAVLPALLKAADSTDPEVALRAKQILDKLPKDIGVDATAAALRVLGKLRPEGTNAVLVGYLPDAGHRGLEEDVIAILKELNGKEGIDAALRQATLDKHPLRRRAAALCLARSEKPEDRPFLKALVKDKDLVVRREAVFGLVRTGDKSVVVELLEFIDSSEPGLALQADELMRRIAGDKGVPAALDSASVESCRQCRAGWQEWWQANENKIDLAARLRPLGLTVIGESFGEEGGQVFECGSDGKPRWKIAVYNPTSVQRLPNNHLLIANFSGEGSVTEYDADGKEVWTKQALWPVSCQRLANGNTFIATESTLQEVTRGGRVVFFLRLPKHIYQARKLDNGHIVYLHSQGHIVELNANGEEERIIRIPDLKSWGAIDMIGADRFLLANYGANRVVEIDAEGRVLWEVKVDTPSSATRLANGHTLVASAEGRRVIEFDRTGRKVWEQTTRGKPHFVSRR